MTDQTLLSPTESAQRINSVDVIRGVALLGILLMNINGFGLYHAYSDPTVSGGATGWNLKVWWTTQMFFEGTMRGMFSMLFGAGVVLFTSRAIPTISGVSVTDAYFRRILWLFLFGIIHSYVLLWHGEVLYPYALVGLFAFSFRHLNPKKLIGIAVVLLCISTATKVKDYVETKSAFDHATEAQAKKTSGVLLTKEEAKSIEEWDEIVADEKPSPEKVKAKTEAYHQGYFSVMMMKAPINEFMQTTFMYRFFFWDIFAMMLFGMAFLKNGIFKGEKSTGFYLRMVLIGYSIGLTTNYLETSYIVSHEFSILSFKLTDMSYEVGRIFTTLGQIGLIMLFIKSGFLLFLQKSLAAVGRMAFSNYVMQSFICNTIFLGFGFGMFGLLQRHQLYYVVFGVWVFQLIVSPIWLTFFRFGPLEWGWRSLTYWQKQPFLKTRD